MMVKKTGSKDTSEVDLRIGAKMNEIRLSLGITRKDLAEQIGVTHQQLQKYERGINRITVSRMIDIAKHLNTPPTFFLEIATGTSQEIPSADAYKQRVSMELMRDFNKIERSDQQESVRRLVKALSSNQISEV